MQRHAAGTGQFIPDEALIPGQRFGRWCVVRDLGVSGGRRRSKCRCSCGVVRTVENRSLRRGGSLSCGCPRGDSRTRHGATRNGGMTPEYQVWKAMIQRCEDKRSAAYVDYGGRGIAVCRKWRRSFAAFLADVGRRPAPRLQLGRINNDVGYRPGNVRWETAKQNARNRRSNRIVVVDGEALALAAWAERSGNAAGLIRQRLLSGWTPAAAVFRPVRPTRQARRK